MKASVLKALLSTFLFVTIIVGFCSAQPLDMSKVRIIQYTPEWKGERFPDGRPKVPDDILERMKAVKIEEAWQVLMEADYDYQFERGWYLTQPEGVLVGRAVTALYMPKRPVMEKVMVEQAAKEGREGAPIHWPINILQKGDVYIADLYCSKIGGSVMGGNLATSIFNKSGNGVVFNGELRDLEQIESMKKFNCFVRGANPTWWWSSMLIGINIPINIGEVTVMPGDIILGKKAGLIVIPPHFAEKICKASELTRLRDEFGFQRLKEEKYTPGQVDSPWTEEMDDDFTQWLQDNIDKLSVPRNAVLEILKERKK